MYKSRNLYHVESKGFNELQLGEIINITGNEMRNYGNKIISLINNEENIPENDKIVLKNYLINNYGKEEDIIHIINKIELINFNNRTDFLRIRNILVELYFELNRNRFSNLPSRLRSIFLTDRKNLSLWLLTLPKKPNNEPKKIYEFKVIETYNCHEGDENLLNDGHSLNAFTYKYWEGSTTRQLKKIEIIFQGKLETIGIYEQNIFNP